MDLTIHTPGIYDVSADDYHLDPCVEPSLNFSIAKLLVLETPRHAWMAHTRLNDRYARVDKEAFDIGTAAHSVLLEGIDNVEVIDAPDWRTKVAKEARAYARASGKTPLLATKHAAVLAMVHAARSQLAEFHDGSERMFSDGQPERTLLWRDDETWCRARLDYVRTVVDSGRLEIDDYKTAESANPDTWTRGLFTFGYDLQQAWYVHGLKQLTGESATFRFAVQETAPPYALSVIALGPDAETLAIKKRLYALEVWRKCLEENHWPGYPTRTCFASLPAWQEAAWLEKECR